MAPLPSPFRAAIGLAATAVEEARHLPDKAIELPMLAVSSVLQLSLRAQQRYAALTSRGDELLAGRSVSDEPPAWATFDDASGAEATGSPAHPSVDSPAEAPASANGVVTPLGSGRPSGANGAATDRAAVPSRPRVAKKTVRAPRNATPSAFDAVGDD